MEKQYIGGVKISKRTGRKYRLVLVEEEEKKDIQCCGNEYCDNTENLKKGMDYNRYGIWGSIDNPPFSESMFCPDCYDEYSNTDCYYCKKSIPNGKEVVMSDNDEFSCIPCDVSKMCCPKGHLNGQYGCDFCCWWELEDFLAENDDIFDGVYCAEKHYRMLYTQTWNIISLLYNIMPSEVEKMKVSELKALIRQHNLHNCIKGFSTMKREELIKAVNFHIYKKGSKPPPKEKEKGNEKSPVKKGYTLYTLHYKGNKGRAEERSYFVENERQGLDFLNRKVYDAGLQTDRYIYEFQSVRPPYKLETQVEYGGLLGNLEQNPELASLVKSGKKSKHI